MADAVLYEGYLLYPYRRSSGKNRIRWQFGVLAPQPWAEAHGLTDTGVAGSAESWFQQTECLLEAAADTVLHVRVRFLQRQAKTVERLESDGRYTPVDTLDVDGRAELAFDEAIPCETDEAVPLDALLAGARTFAVEAPSGEETAALTGPHGRPLGRVVRRRRTVSATTTLAAERVDAPFRLYRLRVTTANTAATVPVDATRDAALQSSLLATHTFLGGTGVSFLSLVDPPAWAAAAAQGCRNVHTFPVLAGADGDRDLVLSSPILLYDHPQVAPESPGDLFDATEIDEILSLRALTLTDAEKAEARATDGRAADLLDRVDGLPPEAMARLHGAVRSLRPAGRAEPAPADGDAAPWPRPSTPWWEPGGDASVSPETDSVLVDGVAVTRGSVVRLRPRGRGADAHDMFLDGRTARVAAVFLDVDGSRHIAVTVDDDPGGELADWYGRYRYFRPDEVEPYAEPGGS